MNNPPISTWSAAVSTEEQSLVWPQRLLDWYFTGIDATWSVADNTYRYPCNATLPDFTFGLGNGTFTIPGTYMPYQRDVTSTTCITIVTGDNSTDSSHEYTFGLGWSQLGVLALDYENYRVGFMNSRHLCQSSTSRPSKCLYRAACWTVKAPSLMFLFGPFLFQYIAGLIPCFSNLYALQQAVIEG
jgi:hypothetical protein